MKITFPNDKKVYLQNNRTNVYPLGNVWSTMSIDTQDNLGALRVTPRLKLSTSSSDDADLGCPVAFKAFDTLNWAICDTHIFHNNGSAAGSWTDDASTGFQTNYTADESDMENFNGTLCATTTNGLYSKAASGSGTGSWTSRDSLSGGSPHTTCYFKKFNRLYYSDLSSKIRSIDASWVTADPGVDYAIDLSPADSDRYFIAPMKASSDFVWIGTLNLSSQGGLGKVCQWDGQSAQLTNEFAVNNAQGILSIAIEPKTDSPWVMDSNGILSAWTSTGFQELGRLPYPANVLPYNVADADNERFIHPNGSYFTKNGNYRCVINNRANAGNVQENIPSGVWEWTKEYGFQHVEPFTYNPAGSTTITDWGQNRISRVGAIASMNVPTNSSADGTTLVGATIYTDASNTKSAIFFDNSLDTIQKKGYVVTDWFESREVADLFARWWTSYRQRLDATDKIVWKYRTVELTPAEGTITWVNTTSFTIANSSVDVSVYFNSANNIYGEVEILRGDGGALCAHITNAVLAAGTWTVTIDETATGATTNTATARFQLWTKLNPSEDPGSLSTWSQYAIDQVASAPRVQLKGCFTFTGAGEFYKGVLVTNEDITTKQ